MTGHRAQTGVLSTPVASGVLAGWAGLMWIAYARERRRQAAAKQQDPDNEPRDRSKVLLKRQKAVDHPAFGWLFENGAVWLMAMVTLRIHGTIKYRAVVAKEVPRHAHRACGPRTPPIAPALALGPQSV
eukprot:m.111605 g.111605  ORF g.111605 m.111605 type:complete len:129 (-) comp21373_c0_seq7:2406-2792(-)